MEVFTNGWYVAYTKPCHEKKAVTNLNKAGIKSFLPVLRKLRVRSDRRVYIQEPLFPSYVFVWLDGVKHYFTSLDMDSILYYVKVSGKMARVKDGIVNNLQLVIDQFNDKIEVTTEHIKQGTSFVISDGAFTGFCCEVVEHQSKERLLVRIELLKRNILLNVPIESLMPAALQMS